MLEFVWNINAESFELPLPKELTMEDVINKEKEKSVGLIVLDAY